MNIQDLFARKLNVPVLPVAVGKSPIDDRPVMASVLLNTIPATFGSGNIGRLAVNIIANELLAAGADPRYLSGTVTIDIDTSPDIIEEVADALCDAAVQAQMEWATADTILKPSGPSTGIAISLFGVGSHITHVTLESNCPRPGDSIIITGPIGATGAAIHGAGAGVEVISDCDGRPLTDVMRAVNDRSFNPTAVYFPVRGISSALNALGIKADIDRKAVPVDGVVASACGIMGVDPLDLATSSAMLICVAAKDAEALVEAIRRNDGGDRAAIIGTVK